MLQFDSHWARKRVVRHMLPALEADFHLPQLGHAARFQCRGAPSATSWPQHLLPPWARSSAQTNARHRVVANAVLMPIGVVGMPGAEGLDNVAVILAALIVLESTEQWEYL